MTDSIRIDASSFASFSRDLKKASPELQKELRTGIRVAGEIVATDARRRAGDFSTRIPGAIKVGVAAGSSRVGRSGVSIRVYVDKKKAPHGRPIEGIGGNSTFRHPTDGPERQHWVNQPTKHYLAGATRAKKAETLIAARKAVRRALRQVHSHGI